MSTRQKKRNNLSLLVLMLLVCFAVLGGYVLTTEEATAQSKTVNEIKVAVVYPLSGPFSRNGNLTVQGTKAAMSWVNDNGGIKSLGGAKLVPIIADTGATVEGAASAMERICRDPNIIMSMGCWSSAFTMSATEITERLGIPQFSEGFSDQLTARGFKWGFYTVPSSSGLAEFGMANVIALAKSAGNAVKTGMLVGDNAGGATWFYNAVRKLFPDMGIKIIGEEIWAMGTMTDATPVMQKVKTLNPDIVVFMATAISEAQMCLMKKKELGITTPFVSAGGWAVDPSFQQIGAEVLEGMITITPAFPNKLTPQEWITRSLNQCRKEYSNEPYAGQDLTWAWTMVPIMAEILERARSTDRNVIWETARKMDIHDVMATRYIPKQGMAFDKDGRMAKKYQGIYLVQWQGGVPRTVYPNDIATAKPIWVLKK
jgi:branched-chain amino acid transport system substrate-binding protein